MGKRLADALYNDSNGYVDLRDKPDDDPHVQALGGGWYLGVSTSAAAPAAAQTALSTGYARVKGQHPILLGSDSVTITWPSWSVCGHCEQTVFLDPHGIRGMRDRAVWVHRQTGQMWCRADKQHGPKTRKVFPLPSLLVIEEMAL